MIQQFTGAARAIDGLKKVAWERCVLAAQVLRPRVSLTCYHGVFGLNRKRRLHVTRTKRGKELEEKAWCEKAPSEHPTAMTWMQRLKRVFTIAWVLCLSYLFGCISFRQ